MRRSLFTLMTVLMLSCCFVRTADGRLHLQEGRDFGLGLPLGPSGEPTGLEKCPQGVHTVHRFLDALRREDWKGMYELLDPGVKEHYSFEQAEFDFQFLEYHPYQISSVIRSGDNFEFLLSAGDWKYGDKTNVKMLISGKSYGVLLSDTGSPFRRSLGSYF